MANEFRRNIKEKAKRAKKRIIFPEGEEDRVLEACKILLEEGIAQPVLVGDFDKIKWRLGELHYSTEIRDPKREDTEDLANMLFELRKHKGMTLDEARNQVKDEEIFSTLLLHRGDVEGLVSGSTHTTADTLRPALQIIKTKEDIMLASSFFIMIIDKKIFMFADCGFNIKPSSEELAEIAYSTVQSARFFDIDPKVAFLSFSTKGSANHEDVKKIKEAVDIFSRKDPRCVFDGELQLDAAIIPFVHHKKCPSSPLKGDANVLIFPDLNSGNIGYKLAQWIGGATAIGPIIQGLKKPVNDLSRGCSVEDIIDVAAITAIQAIQK